MNKVLLNLCKDVNISFISHSAIDVKKILGNSKLHLNIRVSTKLQKNFVENRSSHPEVFLRKNVLKICSKFTGDPCRRTISIKLLCNFIEITLGHGCSPVNLLRMFQNTFSEERLWTAASVKNLKRFCS